jgi:hypothetical protein
MTHTRLEWSQPGTRVVPTSTRSRTATETSSSCMQRLTIRANMRTRVWTPVPQGHVFTYHTYVWAIFDDMLEETALKKIKKIPVHEHGVNDRENIYIAAANALSCKKHIDMCKACRSSKSKKQQRMQAQSTQACAWICTGSRSAHCCFISAVNSATLQNTHVHSVTQDTHAQMGKHDTHVHMRTQNTYAYMCTQKRMYT